MDHKKITIKSKIYDYTVMFVEDFAEVLRSFGDNVVYVIDKNVYQLYQQALADVDMQKTYLMEPVEGRKNMETVMEIISFWKSLSVKKNWKVICIGGGITQDVTTIASNLFLRNVQWYFFPTTLLAMCDSCIGGKCGINLGQYKNQIGVFYPPKHIYIDTRFLNTLSVSDYLNGWGELLKFSLTLDTGFYEEIKQEEKLIPCDNIGKYIHRGLQIKQTIIEQDEFESDLRRVLNYGHTFGHALEAYTHNDVPHGKGVIWGIDVVNFLAWKEGLITEEYYYDIKGFIKEAFFNKAVEIPEPEVLFEIIKTDKKVTGNILNFAMLDSHSHLIVYPMSIDDRLKRLFKEYIESTYEYYND